MLETFQPVRPNERYCMRRLMDTYGVNLPDHLQHLRRGAHKSDKAVGVRVIQAPSYGTETIDRGSWGTYHLYLVLVNN